MAIKDAINVNIGCILDKDITAQNPLIAVNGGLYWFIKYILDIERLQVFDLRLFQIFQGAQQ